MCAAGHPIVNRGMWGGMGALPKWRDPDSNQGHQGRAAADAGLPAFAGSCSAHATCSPQLSSRPGDLLVPDGGLAWPRDAPTHEVLL